MSDVDTKTDVLCAMKNFAAGASLTSIMYPEGANENDGIEAIDRLFTSLDRDKDYLERRRAVPFAIAMAGNDRWRVILMETRYPHQLAVCLLAALSADVPSRDAISILEDWLGVRPDSKSAVQMLPDFVDAMFGMHWRIFGGVDRSASWRETFDAILRQRPAFAAGVLRGEAASVAIALPKLEFEP
jgi:hypothetical protein